MIKHFYKFGICFLIIHFYWLWFELYSSFQVKSFQTSEVNVHLKGMLSRFLFQLVIVFILLAQDPKNIVFAATEIPKQYVYNSNLDAWQQFLEPARNGKRNTYHQYGSPEQGINAIYFDVWLLSISSTIFRYLSNLIRLILLIRTLFSDWWKMGRMAFLVKLLCNMWWRKPNSNETLW